MLWNPGPSYLDGETLASTPTNENACVKSLTFLSEAELVGNPSSYHHELRCVNEKGVEEAVTVPANGAAPTYLIDTRSNKYEHGWTFGDLNKYPGWSVWFESGGGGTPIQFQFLNSSEYLFQPEPCRLTEVGLSYQRWPYPDSMFKGDFHLSEFKNVDASFEARVSRSVGPIQCTEFPTADISADFHVQFLDPVTGKVEKNQLLGVLLYADPKMERQTFPSEGTTFWSTESPASNPQPGVEIPESAEELLIGSRLSPPVPSMTPEGAFVPYTIDFKHLIEAKVKPPPGRSIGEAVVSGLDVYTSARGADLNLQLRDVDVYGLN
jgi:hypothetical protein